MDADGGDGGLEIKIGSPELYDSARAKIDANLRWLFAKAYGEDYVPDDLRDPFYVDQYGVEHIKPPVLELLLSAELYSRVCAFLSLGEQSTTRHTHLSVLQLLARQSIHVLESDGTPVTHHDLISSPIRMVRYRRDHVSSRILPHLPVVEDLMKDLSDGVALLTVIHYYCPEYMRIDDICLKDVLSLADSVYNIQLLREFSNEYLNRCMYLRTEDLLYAPAVLKHNVMVYVAELFWWFEVMRPDFVKPKDLHDIKEVRTIAQPKSSHSHMTISNFAKRGFMSTSPSVDSLATGAVSDTCIRYFRPLEESGSVNKANATYSLHTLKQRQQNPVQEDEIAEFRNRSSSLSRMDGYSPGSRLAWMERRHRPISQLEMEWERVGGDNISLVRTISKDSLASNVISVTPRHHVNGQPSPDAAHSIDGEEREEELVAIMGAGGMAGFREAQPESFFLEPLQPAVLRPNKEKITVVSKREESGEGQIFRRRGGHSPTNHTVINQSFITVDPVEPENTNSVQSGGFFLHGHCELPKHGKHEWVGGESESEIEDEEKEDDFEEKVQESALLYQAVKLKCPAQSQEDDESAKLCEDVRVCEHGDKDGTGSPCPGSFSQVSSTSSRMTSFAERRMHHSNVHDGYSSASSSHATTPDGSDSGTLSPDVKEGVVSDLVHLRLQLEDKRRAIEAQKKKMEVLAARQRLHLGKAAFLNVVRKGRSDTLPRPVKQELVALREKELAKDDTCTEVLKAKRRQTDQTPDKEFRLVGENLAPSAAIAGLEEDNQMGEGAEEEEVCEDLDLSDCSRSIELLNDAIGAIQQQMMQLSVQQELLIKQTLKSPSQEYAKKSPSPEPKPRCAMQFVEMSTATRRPPKLSSSRSIRNKPSELKLSKENSTRTGLKVSARTPATDPRTPSDSRTSPAETDEKDTPKAIGRNSGRGVARNTTFRLHDSGNQRTEGLELPKLESPAGEEKSGSEKETIVDPCEEKKAQLIEVPLSDLTDTPESAEQKSGLGFFFKDDQKAADELAKKRAAFLLKQQKKAEEARLRKQQLEAESELKRDETRRKAEEERMRKEEEKARRELIKQEYLRRKQQELMEEQGMAKPRPHRRRPRNKSLNRGQSGTTTPVRLCAAPSGSSLSLASAATEADSVTSGGGSQSAKSNKLIIQNAIAHCCLAGKVNEAQKNAVLEEIERCEVNHLMILFRDAGCQFRALYAFMPDTEELTKLSGTGPRAITRKMIDTLFKYSSDRKQFTVIPAKTVSASVDAITIHNHLWQLKPMHYDQRYEGSAKAHYKGTRHIRRDFRIHRPSDYCAVTVILVPARVTASSAVITNNTQFTETGTSMFPGQKMSPSKAMTMKDYENQITALKKENFNLKLRIYFLEERVQQKCDDSTEEIYKTSLRCAEDEVEKMASIAEQEKLRSIKLEKELEAVCQSGPLHDADSARGPDHKLQQALQEKERLINQLRESIKKQDALIGELQERDQDQPIREQMLQLNKLIGEKDAEVQALKEELDRERGKAEKESQILSGQLEERESELAGEKKNALKRDKTIQGLSILLKEKERQVDELYGNLEEKERTLTKAREALHKAQLQKYQGGEEQQALLQSQNAELSRLQAECHSSLLELQRLQRALSSRDAQLELLQQDKVQLENELELLQQHKRKGDKTINDLQNQLKKLSGELAERENLLEHQRLAQQEETRTTEQKLQSTIQQLTTNITKKEQQLQEYMSMMQHLEQNQASAGSDVMLAKLREKLREKEKALEKALDEKFVAVEEKENEIHLLQLSMREKDRDLERLNHLLTHNEETVNSFDALLKEKDMELQQLLNSFKNLQRSKQESEENLQRALREKDSIIQQLQYALQLKTKDTEDGTTTGLTQSDSQEYNSAEQMSQRLKVTEAMLIEEVKHRERLVCENQTVVDNLLATISSKDQLLKESAERHSQALGDQTAELQDLRRQLADTERRLSNGQNLSAGLKEKDVLINKLLDHTPERDLEVSPPQVVELRQTINILQQRLEEKEDELSQRRSEENSEKLRAANKKPVMSLAELQSSVSELEGRLEGQTANVESLKSIISTKDEIITELQQHLSEMGLRRSTVDHHSQAAEELSFRSLPQRERTVIGGDRQQQQETLSLGDLCSEQAELNHILREEQQLYTKLIHAVKEQDSVQQLQSLQLELSSVTLLRQQLEDGVRNNNKLREQLHQEIQRVNQREGVDPAELKSMRDALEDAQRWNASLQARLGQIQSRGGGVGQANDTGEGQEEELQQLSIEQLRLKVSELQAKNAELQKQLAQPERDVMSNSEREPQGQRDLIGFSPPCTKTADDSLEVQRRMASSPSLLSEKDNGSVSYSPGQQSENEQEELAALLRDCGAESISQLREQVNKLRSEMSKLGVLLKEETVAESKESTESSGENDSHTNLHQTVQTLRSEARSHRKIVRLLKEQLLRDRKPKTGGEPGLDSERVDSMTRKMERLRKEHEATQRHAAILEERLKEVQSRERNEDREQEEKDSKKKGRQEHSKKLRHAAYSKSRLPVAIRPAKPKDRHRMTHHDPEKSPEPLSTSDSEQLSSKSEGSCGAVLQRSSENSFKTLRGSESRQNREVRKKSKNVSDIPQSELLSQLELLNQECQEKTELISQLQLQMQNWEKLQAELQEKERLNSQYLEALHAAESTIAYLTACNLDSESGLGQPKPGSDSSLQQQCSELQRAVQEKDQVSIQLLECLNKAEAAMASLTSANLPESFFSAQKDPHALSERFDFLLSQIKTLQEQKNACTSKELQQNRLNAELQEKLRAAEETITKLSAQDDTTTGQKLIYSHSCTSPQKEMVDEYEEGQQRLAASFSECIFAVEQAVGSLAEYGLRSDRLLHGVETSTNAELEQNLDRLQKVLLERDRFWNSISTDISHSTIVGPFHQPVHHNLQILDAAQQKTSTPISQEQQGQQKISETCDPDRSGSQHLNLYKNLTLLVQIFKQHALKVRELEEALKVKPGQDLKANREDVVKSLQKALKENQKMCQKLEKKLASAQSIIALQNSSRKDKDSERHKAPCSEQEDKGVQVDAQDLGYETSGKSETDVEKEEGSTTDGGVCLDPGVSGFTSADNLNTTASSPSYPSSPDLSSPRPSDPSHELLQLRSLVKHQHKVIAQLQQLLPKNCLTAEVLTCNPASCEEEEEDRTALKARLFQLTPEPEKEQTIDRSNESASPSRMESLVQSQARELCELREQIRVSRTLGAGQRRQLLELRGALEELMAPNDGQSALSPTIRKHLDQSLSLLDKLEQADSCVEKAELPGLELFQRKLVWLLEEQQWLRNQLEHDRGQHQLQVAYLCRQNQNLALATQQHVHLLTAELQEKETLIQQLKNRLFGKVSGTQQGFESETSDRSSNDGNVSVQGSLNDLHTRTTRGATEGLKSSSGESAPDSESHPSSVCVAAGSTGSQGEEGSVFTLQRDNSRLQEQLKKSEELNATLRSELDLTHSILTHTQNKQKENDSLRKTLARRTAKLELSRKEYEERGGSESSDVDLKELLGEVRSLRLQLEKSIQTNTALRHKLEQQLLTQSDPPSTININYLLSQTDDGGKSEMLRQHSHTDPSSAAYGHRLWADRHGQHVLGLVEDYSALSKQIREAKRITSAMDTQLQDRNVLRSEITQLKSRLSQQERMLTGAVKRLRSTNQLKEGMERIIIEQLSLTHGVLKKARGNLEEIPLNAQ
ncbi:Calmodulin-regulated spectrin-associated protein 1-B [Bagarius yarrelli]|uniref:Calmodulin-regulated spectrin-associated protein 1-B n=1 Tax=Bagarius yarrelli TaxID=175774 RepID=A0A556TU63_BAGYA|nr:Calmodulin-regulated spectrin-associated protein 1-B [Bagarius yarrelli]